MKERLSHDEVLVIAVNATDRIMKELFGAPVNQLSEIYNRSGMIGHEFGSIVRNNLIDFAECELVQAEDQSALLRPAECSTAFIHGVDCGCDELACSPLDAKLSAQGLIFLAIAALEDKAELIREELQKVYVQLCGEYGQVERSARRDATMVLSADVLEIRLTHLQQLIRMFELKKELNHNDDSSTAAEGSAG